MVPKGKRFLQLLVIFHNMEKSTNSKPTRQTVQFQIILFLSGVESLLPTQKNPKSCQDTLLVWKSEQLDKMIDTFAGEDTESCAIHRTEEFIRFRAQNCHQANPLMVLAQRAFYLEGYPQRVPMNVFQLAPDNHASGERQEPIC